MIIIVSLKLKKIDRQIVKADWALVVMEETAKELGISDEITDETKELFKEIYPILGQKIIVHPNNKIKLIALALSSLFFIIRRDFSCPAVTLGQILKISSYVYKERRWGKPSGEYYAGGWIYSWEIIKIYHKIGKLKDETLPQKSFLKPDVYIKSFSERLGLSEECIKKAIELGNLISKDFVGYSPISIAASSLYFTSVLLNERYIMKKFREEFSISRASVYRMLYYIWSKRYGEEYYRQGVEPFWKRLERREKYFIADNIRRYEEKI